MVIALDSLFSGGIDLLELDYDFDLSGIAVGGEHPFKTPVHIEGEITNHAGLVELDADAFVSYTAMCDRCCEMSTADYAVPIVHEFVTSVEGNDEGDFIVLPDMKLDLQALVTEDILLDLPPVFLCKDDCKGLCPVCGVNLNETQCNCAKPIDPRLEALAALMNE